MGLMSKAASLLLRFWQLACASIVAGLFGQYLHYLDLASAPGSGRIIYAVVLAGISILAALLLMILLKHSFRIFILDFIFFICWMVAFGLVTNLAGTHGCHSGWYWRRWGYFWGGWWRRAPVSAISASTVGTAACGKWRTPLAFSILGGWGWFISGIIGAYMFSKSRTREGISDGMNDMSRAPNQPHHWYHGFHHSNYGGPNDAAAADEYEIKEPHLQHPDRTREREQNRTFAYS
ncbi:hypothetical protein F5884DRAFT_440708 [Xylogone sp. PMI_703]|nr:hypothetical protein F5884DRAFT_440708 [Xylogone sp. PMI_703]